MFDIGWGELLLIGVVALIVIGPKELPAVLRAVGQWTGKMRRMAAEFQGQFQEALREAEMADLHKHVTDVGHDLSSQFDPLDFTGGKQSEPAATPASGSDAAASPDTPAAGSSAPAEPTQQSADVAAPPPVPAPTATEHDLGAPPHQPPQATTSVGDGRA